MWQLVGTTWKALSECSLPFGSRKLRVWNYPSIRHLVTRRRFYRKTGITYNEGHYEITLDQRKLKTPRGNLFFVKNELLALAIATEWDAQKEHIIPGVMHLTGLCSTAIDNPNKLTKEKIVDDIITFVESDTVLFHSQEDDELYDLQKAEWIPIIEWFCKRFGVRIMPVRDIVGPEIKSETKDIVRKYFLSYDIWSIHGFNFVVDALKSVILGVLCCERHITVEKAVLLSRLEEEFQVSEDLYIVKCTPQGN